MINDAHRGLSATVAATLEETNRSNRERKYASCNSQPEAGNA